MKALGITALVIVLVFIIVAGSMQLRKRRKEKDKTVADVAEIETKTPEVELAGGIKPTNLTKVFTDLKSKTAILQVIGQK